MFTKYNDINLPKNYSGTKFKQNIEDTKMKTHRAQDEMLITKGVVRTSVSPSFQSALDKTMQEANTVSHSPSEENSLIDENTSAFSNEEAGSTVNDSSNPLIASHSSNDCCDESTESPSNEEKFARKNTCDEKNTCSSINLLKDSGLSRLIEGINKDDILLIALIILFAQEHLDNSLDAIVILALLLLYH